MPWNCITIRQVENAASQPFIIFPLYVPPIFLLHFRSSGNAFQDIAEAIINNAIKELSIEKGVKEIESTWETMAFSVYKHYKGSEERGYFLGSVEEIIQVLEDNSMNLQSMGASQ